MQVALNKSTGQRVYAYEEAQKSNKSNNFICPICQNPVILRAGEINIPHFAHVSLEVCDTFSSDMSAWHLAWQRKFHPWQQEVMIDFTIPKKEYFIASRNHDFPARGNERLKKCKGDSDDLHIIHRADVLVGNLVIEFQHSPLTAEEFNERTWFYQRAGKKILWIFDLREQFQTGKIRTIHQDEKQKRLYIWPYAMQTLQNIFPQDYQTDKNFTILLQFRDESEHNPFLERLIWCAVIQSGEMYDPKTQQIRPYYGKTTCKRFATADYPGTLQQLKHFLLE